MTKRYIEESPERLKRATDRGLNDEFIMRCFLDRALDLSNMQSGQFALSYAVMGVVNILQEVADQMRTENGPDQV